MPEIPTLLEMLKSGMHFGHRTAKRHPKMASNIFMSRSGVHIINLEETVKLLAKSLDYVRDTASKGGVILFLGTKKQAQAIVKKYALECGMPYVTERWLGGTITNFSTIRKLFKKLKDLKAKEESGELKKYTKKEQINFTREIKKLETRVGGIQDLQKLPDVVYILDIKKEQTALSEVRRKKIPVVAICDTNVNPELVNYPIPANDDATKSIEMVTRLIAEAVNEGKAMAEKGGVESTKEEPSAKAEKTVKQDK